MALSEDRETYPLAKGVFWASSDPELNGWVISWQNVSLPYNKRYRIWIGAKLTDGVVEGFRELTIQSFRDGYLNITDEEVRARLRLLSLSELDDDQDSVNEVSLTSDLFRALRIGEVLETHSRAISTALSEDANRGDDNRIRLYKPAIIRYSYLKFPEGVLPKSVKTELSYDSRSAILLARVYCRLAETGENKLAKRTASLLGVEVSLVHSAVKIARKRGWMSVGQQGKAGGVITELGEREFRSSGQEKLYEQVIRNLGGKKNG